MGRRELRTRNSRRAYKDGGNINHLCGYYGLIASRIGVLINLVEDCRLNMTLIYTMLHQG